MMAGLCTSLCGFPSSDLEVETEDEDEKNIICILLSHMERQKHDYVPVSKSVEVSKIEIVTAIVEDVRNAVRTWKKGPLTKVNWTLAVEWGLSLEWFKPECSRVE